MYYRFVFHSLPEWTHIAVMASASRAEINELLRKEGGIRRKTIFRM